MVMPWIEPPVVSCAGSVVASGFRLFHRELEDGVC
jgi:hypothetical protein